MFGFVADNHMDELAVCLNDSADLYQDSMHLIEDVIAGKWPTAADEVKLLSTVIPKMFGTEGDCTNLLKDVQAIEKWADRSWLKLAEDVASDMLFHRHEIVADAETIKTDFDASEYYNSGVALADLMTLSLGEIEPKTEFLQ